MKTLTVKLPESLVVWLARRSKALGCPQSDLIRDALERFRDEDSATNCHNLMADVCGGMSGPRDLSTNPKFLDGFSE